MNKHKLNNYLEDNQIMVVFSEAYFDFIMKQKNWGDLHALYSFCCLCEQENIKITNSYISIKMKWSIAKIIKIKNRLKECNLIEDKQTIKTIKI